LCRHKTNAEKKKKKKKKKKEKRFMQLLIRGLNKQTPTRRKFPKTILCSSKDVIN